MTTKPKPVMFSSLEGGNWYPWDVDSGRERKQKGVFAVKFDDGSIFDPIAGWRDTDANQMRDDVLQQLADIIVDIKENWK